MQISRRFDAVTGRQKSLEGIRETVVKAKRVRRQKGRSGNGERREYAGKGKAR